MDNREVEVFREKFQNKLLDTVSEKQQIELDEYHVILEEAIQTIDISDETSKKVYIHIGSYINTPDGSRLTYADDPNLNFKLYRDIETEEIEKIDKKIIKIFEQKNRVIFPAVLNYETDEYVAQYETLRYIYYEHLLHSDQNAAYRLIKKLTPDK